MKRIKLTILLVGVLVAGVFAGKTEANAEEETVLRAMTVSPTSQRLILDPGESYTGSFKVSNYNDSIGPIEYVIEAGSFSQSKTDTSKDDYGVVDHVAVSNYNQIKDWITFENDKGVVEPNEVDVLTYTINVPKDAPAGGQYATILVRDETGNSNKGDGNVSIQSAYQFAIVIFAEITGESREEGAVLENNIPTIMFNGPLVASSMVRNDGNVHTDAVYTLEVKSLFSGDELYSNVDEPAKSLVLPETERYNMQEWKETPAVGIFRVKQTVDIFGNVSTNERIVVICPLWLLFIITFVIVLIIIWLVSRRSLRKSAKKE